MDEIKTDLPSRTLSKLAVKSAVLGIVVNILLAALKGISGFIGNSHALIADAIESLTDVFSSIVVLFGLKMAGKPPDENHPYGHGKFEPLAAAIVSLILVAAAILIAVASVNEIMVPQQAPAPFTLAILAIVIIIKEIIFKKTFKNGVRLGSTALKVDAWHHRSDVLTSVAAFIGISIAIFGGSGYESADDYAALLAAFVITVNALFLLQPALHELIDTAPNPELIARIRKIAAEVPGVHGTHQCHIRKMGFDYFVTLDVLCDPNETIRHGHDIAHAVGEAIGSQMPEVSKVLVHIEPYDDFARY